MENLAKKSANPWEVTEELLESDEVQIIAGIQQRDAYDVAEEFLAWRRWLEYKRPTRVESNSIYEIARFLKKPVTPPDLSRALPSLSSFLVESDKNKTCAVIKTNGGNLAYIVWGVVVFGKVGFAFGERVSHVVRI